MQELQIPTDPRVKHVVIFAVSIVAMIFGWRWGAQLHPELPRRAYWIGVTATALPALAAWWSSIALRKQRSNGHAPRMEQVFDALRWIALALFVVAVLFPLL